MDLKAERLYWLWTRFDAISGSGGQQGFKERSFEEGWRGEGRVPSGKAIETFVPGDFVGFGCAQV